jgi:two-component system CheB/CheR fusion protein
MDPALNVADWLARVVANSRDHAVVLLDAGGNIIGWQGAAERIFGYPAAEALVKPFSVLFVPEDRALSLHAQELEVARWVGRSEDDRWHLRKDGGRFWGSGLLERVLADNGELQGYCKIVRDRSDVRTQIDSLQHLLNGRDAELAALHTDLLRWGHELRNTAGPILNALRMLQSSDDRAVKRQSLELLDRQVAVLRQLLDDMLPRGDGEPRQPRLRREHVVVGEALEHAVGAQRQTAADRHIELRLLLPTAPISVEADPVRLQQMLSNMLGNALKYTDPGGHVAVIATVEGNELVIRCDDDGVGIAPEMLPHIFDLFSREDASGAAPEGMGVGLAIVREYAALHGGGVEARSAGKGKGTVVALRLPLKAPRGA